MCRGEKKYFIKPVARFELATPCLQGRCNNHYATPACYIRSTPYVTVRARIAIRRHTKKFLMPEVGFEPTPTNRIELKSTALDHSAIQAHCYGVIQYTVSQ